MIPLKSGGKIFGAKLTNAEQKALDAEIGRQAAEWERLHEIEFDAMTLYVLMVEYGWGEKRLRRFFDTYRKAHRALIRRYELNAHDGDNAWLCQRTLKEHGIDIETWDREFNEMEETK